MVAKLATQDHEAGIPRYHKTNTGHALQQRLEFYPPNGRRLGDRQSLRKIYTGWRELLHYESLHRDGDFPRLNPSTIQRDA